MVEISRTSPRKRPAEATKTKRKPLWLIAAYLIFLASCLNALRTYQNQKELVRLKLETQRENDLENETRYSAGAEEHVVTAGVGSSQYGGSVRAKDKKKKTKKTAGTNFLGIRPEPSDGSKDYSKSHPPSDFNGFRFYVMAGTLGAEVIDEKLEYKLAELRNFTKQNPERIPFGIHLGETQKYRACKEWMYQNRANLLAQGPSPIFVTPGKGDWFDCPKQEQALGFFNKHIGKGLLSRWDKNQRDILNVQRSERNPELFRFLYEGILVIGLHVIDTEANEEYLASRDKRLETSMQWLAESVENLFQQHEIRGVVIAGHAGKSELHERFFSKAKKYFAERKDVPVLYLFGNKVVSNIDKISSPFYFVQTGKNGLTTPAFIDVAPQQDGKVKGLREDKSRGQKLLGKKLFRVEQQGGQYLEQ